MEKRGAITYSIIKTMVFILNAIGFLGYDLFYIYAIAEGAKELWHLGSITAIMLGVTTAQMPLLGTIASIIGAMKAWGWGFFFSTYIFAIVPLLWIGAAVLWHEMERATIKITCFLVLLFLASSVMWSIWELRGDKSVWILCGTDNEGCQWYIDSESVTYDHKTELANFRTKQIFSKTRLQRWLQEASTEKDKEIDRQASYDIADCILNYANNTFYFAQITIYSSDGNSLQKIKGFPEWLPVEEGSVLHTLSSSVIEVMLDKGIITVKSFLFGKD